MTGTHRTRAWLAGLTAVVALATAAGTGPAAAQGAWRTYLRPYVYRDLLSYGDTTWCATAEAGLLRYTRTDDRFVSFTRDAEGIAGNQLHVLARDASGRLWAGTGANGVSRLSRDGRWDVLNRFDGLASDEVTTLAASGDTVWIGTTRGISLWDGTQVVGTLPDGINPSPFTNDDIRGIAQMGDSLWIATNGGGLYVTRISTGLPPPSPANANLPATNAYVDMVTDGTALFVLTNQGTLYRRVPGAANWTNVGAVPGEALHLDIDGGAVHAVSLRGFYQWSGGAWSLLWPFESQRSNPAGVPALALDEQGRLWWANQDGLRDQEPGDDPLLHVPDGPPGNDVINVLVDGDRLFVHAYEAGIGILDPAGWRLYRGGGCGAGCDTTYLDPTFPFALLRDRQGQIWSGTWGAAMEQRDESVSPPRFTHHRFPPTAGRVADMHSFAWASAADSSGGRWFGMDTPRFGSQGYEPIGIDYYTPSGNFGANYRPDSLPAIRGGKVHALTVSSDGKVWAGYTGQGLQTFFPPADSSRPLTLFLVPGTDNFDVQGLAAVGDTVWALTTRDVRMYARSSEAFIDSFLLPSEPPLFAIRPLEVTRDRIAYAASSSGLRVRHPDGSIEDFDSRNSPLANDEVRAIAVEPATGAVWIGTASGLNRYDPGYRPPRPPPPAELRVTVYPNPVRRSDAGIWLRLDGNASAYIATVYDMSGRRVRRLATIGGGSVAWDGRDESGSVVHPGIYFVRVQSGGVSRVARVVVIP